MEQEKSLSAYKITLDPNPQQRQQLAQLAGAARVSCNAYVAELLARRHRWNAARLRLLEDGVIPEPTSALMKELATGAPDRAPAIYL